MKEFQTIELFSSEKKESIDKQTQRILDVLTRLSKIESLKPRYRVPYMGGVEDAVQFDLNFENLKNMITAEKDAGFSNISFFTSKNRDDLTVISITIDNNQDSYPNLLDINLLRGYKELNSKDYEELEALFKDLAVLFQAFFGFVTSRSFNNGYHRGNFDGVNKNPLTTLYMNFWGKESIKNLKITPEALSKLYKYEKMKDGYFIRLSKEPLDINNEEHMKLQKEFNGLIGITKPKSFIAKVKSFLKR